MHTQPMSESAGTLNASKPAQCGCRKCGKKEVTYQVWESSCGGYEDFKYTCGACGHVWWVDGIDS